MSRLRLSLRPLAFALASMVAANASQAQVLVNDTFDGLNGGNSQVNYTGFPNLTVLDGTVDLVRSGDFGITCAGGTGSCVDLDGSRNASGRIGTQTFFFSAGERFSLSFDLSGNQRGGTDTFFMRLLFGAATFFTDGTSSGYLSGVTDFGGFSPTFTLSVGGISSSAPWTASALSFTFVNAGQVSVEFGTAGNDNVGPVLDNVFISRSVVPEPSTYALLATGLLGMGVVARRRRR